MNLMILSYWLLEANKTISSKSHPIKYFFWSLDHPPTGISSDLAAPVLERVHSVFESFGGSRRGELMPTISYGDLVCLGGTGT